MPTYEYRCPVNGRLVEVRHGMAERLAGFIGSSSSSTDTCAAPGGCAGGGCCGAGVRCAGDF